ncbi:MAG: CoA pyrophosphatase [Bacteroidota bacterium]
MKNIVEVAEYLSIVLQLELPGEKVQLKMASMTRLQQLTKHLKKDNAIKSSVLILLYPSSEKNEVLFVLIQRPAYNGVHGGQISLPGGKFESSDGDLQNTAIRESFEEIGIPKQDVKIIGALSELYIPPSNYIVSPFVGFLDYKPEFRPDTYEVQEIIEVRLEDLLDDTKIVKKRIHIRTGLQITTPCFEIDKRIIWGATAMILSEFRTLFKH